MGEAIVSIPLRGIATNGKNSSSVTELLPRTTTSRLQNMCCMFYKSRKEYGTLVVVELLSAADALDYKGVVYALINEETGDYFPIQLPTSIGLSSESVLQRCVRQSFDKAPSAAKSGRKPIIVQVFKHTDRWWSKWVVVPLEIIPAPIMLKCGGNKHFSTKIPQHGHCS